MNKKDINNTSSLIKQGDISTLDLSKEIIKELLSTEYKVVSIISKESRFFYEKFFNIVEIIDKTNDVNEKIKKMNIFINDFNMFLIQKEKDSLIFPKFFPKYLEYKKFILINKIYGFINDFNNNNYTNISLKGFLQNINQFEYSFGIEDLDNEFGREELQNYINKVQDILKVRG